MRFKKMNKFNETRILTSKLLIKYSVLTYLSAKINNFVSN